MIRKMKRVWYEMKILYTNIILSLKNDSFSVFAKKVEVKIKRNILKYLYKDKLITNSDGKFICHLGRVLEAENGFIIKGWVYHPNGIKIIKIYSSYNEHIIGDFVPSNFRNDKSIEFDLPMNQVWDLDHLVENKTKYRSVIVKVYSNSSFVCYERQILTVFEIDYLSPREQYEIFLDKYEKIDVDLCETEISKFHYFPKFSIIVPCFNSNPEIFKLTLKSVENQIYKNWELCVYDDCSEEKSFYQLIEIFSNNNPGKVIFKSGIENLNISRASNAAINLASGEYICLLDHDDALRFNALFEVAKVLNKNPELKFIYSDEDKLDFNNLRVEPHFKSDFNYDLLLSVNYICHLSVIKKSIGDRIGWFRSGYEGSQDHDLFIRLTETIASIGFYHISKILYHWRKVPGSTSVCYNNKSTAESSSILAIKQHLSRNGFTNSSVTMNHWPGSFKIIRNILDKSKLVTIIIPFKDQGKYLKSLLTSISKKTDYQNYEILLVDNNSTLKETRVFLDTIRIDKNTKIVTYNGEFNFAKIINWAVEQYCKGNYVLILNNDMEIITNNWLSNMISHAQREEVGAVGAKLLYSNKTIQHAGVVIGMGGIAGHPSKHIHNSEPGYILRPHLTQNLNACTGACLLFRKSVFLQVGGMNESLAVAFNDIDLCLKMRKHGFLIVYEPNSLLYHFESKTRGYDTIGKVKYDRLLSEEKQFLLEWGKIDDEYYNINLDLTNERFLLKR